MNRFKQLRSGAWGVYTEGVPPAGAEVEVTKADKTTTVVVLGKMVWTNGAYALFVVDREAKPAAAAQTVRAPQIRRGERGVRILCPDCGRNVLSGTQCREGGTH